MTDNFIARKLEEILFLYKGTLWQAEDKSFFIRAFQRDNNLFSPSFEILIVNKEQPKNSDCFPVYKFKSYPDELGEKFSFFNVKIESSVINWLYHCTINRLFFFTKELNPRKPILKDYLLIIDNSEYETTGLFFRFNSGLYPIIIKTDRIQIFWEQLEKLF